MDYYQELAEYVNRDVWLVRERCKTARVELAWLWEKYKEDPIKYYRETDLYIFDLTLYQSILDEAGFFAWFKKMLKDFQIKTVLDFGGGCGEYTITSCKNDIKTDYLEIEDSKTLEYAKYRFAKHGVNPRILGLSDSFGKYDLIVCTDVLEHIANYKPILEDIAKKCKYMICNAPGEMPYGPLYPQHVSFVDLSSCFENVTGRLWRSKFN